MEKLNLPDTFQDTIRNTDLSDISKDLVESSIDSFLSDGILKEIPIVKSILGIIKVSSNISEYLFLKKIISFLNEIKEIDPKKRKEEIDKIDSSERYRIKVGEKLLYILDRSDDYEKAEYIAKLFVALLEEKISYDDFIRGSNAINTLSIPDFRLFLSYNEYKDTVWYERNREIIYIEDASLFVAVGLMFFDTEDIIVDDSNQHGNPFNVKGGKLEPIFSSLGNKVRAIFKVI